MHVFEDWFTILMETVDDFHRIIRALEQTYSLVSYASKTGEAILQQTGVGLGSHIMSSQSQIEICITLKQDI